MKIFYNAKQSCASADSYSPSAGKPALFVAEAQKEFNVEVIESSAASSRQFYGAHDKHFVDGVLAGGRENGFGNTLPEVARSLPYTSGSMVDAALHAFATGEHVCSPTSGFHHAGYSGASGYCTFNGLMVAAVALRGAGAKSVGILDCDMHYGNGTDDIIKVIGADYVVHRTFGRLFSDKEDCDDGVFEGWLLGAIRSMKGCDVILYQAGADPHVDDPMGRCLTTEQMRLRDGLVFTAFQGKPLAWNLAGGYQRDADGGISAVLGLHLNTVAECINARDSS